MLSPPLGTVKVVAEADLTELESDPTVDPATVDPATANRHQRWASTMAGTAVRTGSRQVVLAHDGPPGSGTVKLLARAAREEMEDAALAPGATRSGGAGRRAIEEEPDTWRTSFERDRDRILHATAFRRLAGKTQVFVHPADHQRTRLTHALEVAQVATAIARACRLNVALVEAIALAHDCGHGPGGHASEDALSPFLDEGYDHAVWGADVVLTPLNLCAETLDGVRSHSWSRPAPATPEGEVVSWADRIAYVCHDFEDAVAAGVVEQGALPAVVAARCGTAKREQLATFIRAVVHTVADSGQVGMDPDTAEALAAFRATNYRRIYLRPASMRQAESVVAVLRALVEHFADHPGRMTWPGAVGIEAGSASARRAAVTWVGGMTDRYAFNTAVAELGWDPARLPRAVDGR
jgi:dGTPase